MPLARVNCGWLLTEMAFCILMANDNGITRSFWIKYN